MDFFHADAYQLCMAKYHFTVQSFESCYQIWHFRSWGYLWKYYPVFEFGAPESNQQPTSYNQPLDLWANLPPVIYSFSRGTNNLPV